MSPAVALLIFYVICIISALLVYTAYISHQPEVAPGIAMVAVAAVLVHYRKSKKYIK